MRFLLSSLIALGLLAAIGAAVVWFVFETETSKPGPTTQETHFIVAPGEGLSAIAERLEQEGVVRNAMALKLRARLDGVDTAVKTGEYLVPPAASVDQVLALLVSGDVVTYRVTIPEGLTTAQILRVLEADERLAGPVPQPPPAEGALLPDTYAFTGGDTRADLVARMQAAQDALMARLWPERAADLPYETQTEALILASVVEKETGLPEERGEIAGVFVNRLRRGIRLQSDPTIIYGVSKGEPLYNKRGQRRTLYRSEIDTPTPWNTYQIDGLPPTPICNPGRDAIAAVLNPPETDNLFFVADGTGGHAFAETNAEHQRNVRAYRRIEAERIAAERAP